MFIISKLFIYFDSQFVFVNFQLTRERLRLFASGCRFRPDSAAWRTGPDWLAVRRCSLTYTEATL